ncbi:unnamed protein product [Malus baccata var. baccata]
MATASSEGQGVGSCTENLMDRFTNLPTEVAHHILSFISMKTLACFGCVSKRCRDLSLSTPSLDFCVFPSEAATCELRLKLLNSLDRFLFRRGDNKIKSFDLYWDCHYVEDSDEAPCFCVFENFRIVSWIHNAVRCNVEELFLDISLDALEDEGLTFPSCVFLCASLRSLNVVQISGLIIKTPSVAFSSNLDSLLLENVDIEDEGFFKWISCSCKCIKKLSVIGVKQIKSITIESPSLEYLKFKDQGWNEICQLKISGEKLEDISLDWGLSLPSNCSLDIFAPNLKYLHWAGDVINHSNLGEFECLEGASILLEPKVDDFESTFEVLRSLRRVVDLSLNEATVKALFRGGSVPVQLDDIWYLSMYIWSMNDELVPSMVSLLRGMPNLCSLNIECDRHVYGHFKNRERITQALKVPASGFDKEYWKLQNLDFVNQLEEVSIELSDGSNGIELARYILEHAETLENMVIVYLPQQSDVIENIKKSKKISKAAVTFKEI